jgi:hypothetical protein
MDNNPTDWPSEARIDTIGQNGNDGEHYADLSLECDKLRQANDNQLIEQILCLQQIREAIGDPHGKLMQDEVVELVRGLVAALQAMEHAVNQSVSGQKTPSVMEWVELINRAQAALGNKETA